jgi:glycosyltransferase involved in cell wall biosynthesis
VKILVINKFFYPKGGPEVYLRTLTRIQEQHGHEVAAFSMQHAENWPSRYARHFVSEVELTPTSPRPVLEKIRTAARIVWSTEARRKLRSLLAEFHPDIVHAHMVSHQLSPSILPLLKSQGLPVVLTAHEFKLICPNYLLLVGGHTCEACKGRRFYSAVLNKCVKDSYSASALCAAELTLHELLGVYKENVDFFIAPSRFMRRKMIEFGFNPLRVAVVPNFADVGEHVPGDRVGEYVLYFGRLVREKGVATLIDAMKRLPRVRLVIAGDGPQLEELRRQSDACQAVNVEFVGFRTGQSLRDLIAGARCCVVPSEWFENSPMTVYEAYATGKPVIACDIGGLPELVEHRVTGLLVPPKSPDELAAAIRTLMDEAGLAHELGRNARRRVVEEYSLERHFERLEVAYARALRGGLPGPDYLL